MDRNERPDYRGRGPRRSPERIHDDVCRTLTDHPGVDATEIEIQVEGDEVTLTGTVTTRHQKR